MDSKHDADPKALAKAAALHAVPHSDTYASPHSDDGGPA